jgi:RNA-directed DNA polymerase
MEKEESKVLETANPVSEIRAQWAWVEPSVWTDRMLEALENGINGVEESKWFCLIDKVCKPANLMSAWLKTASNDGAAGVDHVTVKGYAKQLETNLERVRDQVGSGVYHPSRIRRTYIPKPGGGEFRPLGIPIVQDRVVGTAVRHVIEPIFEQTFSENSFGFRPGRGCKDALRQVFNLLKVGNHYVVDADLRQCFDRIPHDKLINRVKERVADKKVLELIRRFLKQEILDDGSVFAPENTGTPQGATLSPLLCNIYLNPLDHLMAEEGFDMIRYADDLVVVCRSQQEAERALDVLTQWVEASSLPCGPSYLHITPITATPLLPDKTWWH